MCILPKSPGCKYIISTGYYQKQIKSHSIDTITPKRPRKNTAEKKERKHTRIFFLEKNHQKVQVCQKMFLSTLGLNISFVYLGEEECESCELHSIHLKDVHSLKDADHHIVDPDGKRKKKTFTECNTCDNYTRYISKAIEAQSMYKAEKDREWEPSKVVISVDKKVTKSYNVAASPRIKTSCILQTVGFI